MADKRPNIYAHCSYIGTSGYNNHTRNFFRALSDYFKIKVRNFTIGTSWTGLNNTPHDTEPYLDKLDKELLIEHTVWTANKQLEDHQIYSEYGEILEHDINIVLNETHHHYFYQDYNGPKIAYNVWETTRQPEEFFNKLKDYDQVWVASSWQRDCTIEQGIAPEKVKVVPEAVNGEVFKPDSKASLPDYEDGRFKFVIFGRWDYRKSTKEIIQSFLAEFGKDEPVDLIVSIDNKFARDGLENTEARLKEYKLEDPRIKIIHFPTDQEYVKYLQKGHVFLSCARSEGWNLPLIEAMACGTPSIYSECSGQLEFAKGRGLPVKIKNTLPAKFGEYSSFSQHMMSGEFYEPDFDHLRTVMRDAYINYDTHKEVALKQSKEIREQFTWDNAAQIAGQEILSLYSNLPKNSTQISFEYGPKVEVKGYHRKPYFVEFVDSRNNQVIHSDTIYNNRWTRCNKKFYIPWIIRINGKEVHKFDLTGKKVKISFDSKSVGDTLAWMPQVLEFKNKQNCKVAVSTFHNNWFKNLEVYKDLEFVEPDIPYPAYAHYKIGWFKDGDRWDDGNKNPTQANTVPLIQTITDILGLPYKEINHGIYFKPTDRPIKGKYICIGPRSTAGLKEWPSEYWQELAKKLSADGYKVVNISYEGFEGPHIINKKNMGWEKTWNYLYHAELFIGLGSGLSWMNWALGKHTLMVNNFIPFGYEFTQNLTKIENNSVCNNCWVSKEFVFDAGNWDWCPKHQNTDKQHICQKSITPQQVYNKVQNLLNKPKKENFIWITGGNEQYLPMIEVLAESLLKYSKYKLIVYGFNCDPNIDLPNVVNKRINYNTKTPVITGTEPDLINKDFSIYFAKYLASLDSLNEGYDYYGWLDGDAFVTENIDTSLTYLDRLEDYPLFMRYHHPDISNWRVHNNIRLEGYYGTELSSLKKISRNPDNRIIATGFYLYNKLSKEFFGKCLAWNKELNEHSIRIYVDDNAFSEERVANCILWEEGKKQFLPVTWNNFYSPDEQFKVNPYYCKKGWDVMYDTNTEEVLFIHGPDPSVSPKNANTLKQAFNDYKATKLMVIAHPDDELIFGGSELINNASNYKVVCVSNPLDKSRVIEFEAVMNELGVSSWEILDYEDTLYPTQTYQGIDKIVNSRQWEKIVTHNPVGEYGHPQHKVIFDRVKSLVDDFYVFGKSTDKLEEAVLNRKKELLKIYKSEQPIIQQILTNNGSWYKSNNPNTNYIEFESIQKYDSNKDKTPYVDCYAK